MLVTCSAFINYLLEKQSENIEKKENNKVTPQPNKRILTYRRRDGGENSKTDRT